MTDYLYTSPVAELGYGKRQETINKDVIENPAPGHYDARKNDKIVEPHIRQRSKIAVKQAKEKERTAKRKKDRPQDEVGFKARDRAPPIIHPGEDKGGSAAAQLLNAENVYTLGMAERDKRKVSDVPGPGTHNIKTHIGAGPAYTMGGGEKDTKGERDQTGPSSYNIVLKSRAPKYSFGGRPGITLGFGNKGQFKSMKPGPGAYESNDVQFKKPCTKFSKAGRDSLVKTHGPPPSTEFNPQPAALESNKYSFPRANRLDDPGRDRNARKPGPGEYEVLKMLPKGQAKSMLGGSLDPPKMKDNGVPGPGNYFVEQTESEYLNHIPGVKIVSKPPRFKERADKDDDAKKYIDKGSNIIPHKTEPGFSIGRGLREPIKNKFHTPAPNAYNVVDFPVDEDKKGEDKGLEKKYKFHMGMRTNYKANRGQDMPGPAEYYPDLYEPITHAHLIGTGQRSDLGVGKSYLTPGPGEYEVRGKFEGPQIKFGNEVKNTKIKKTYEPGPANYDLPGTVGNIPRYLRLKQEREEMEKEGDKDDKIDLY